MENVIQAKFGTGRRNGESVKDLSRKISLADLPRKDADMEQLEELFSLAEQIKQIKPWEMISESNYIFIELPDREEPIFCSILGKNVKDKVIIVYENREAIARVRDVHTAKTDLDRLTSSFEVKYSVCIFGNKEGVDDKDREIYNNLGIKFESDEDFVYFRENESGGVTLPISLKNAEIMREALYGIYDSIVTYSQVYDIEATLMPGESLRRAYNEELRNWETGIRPLPPIPVSFKSVFFNDDSEFEELKEIKRKSNLVLELQRGYVQRVMQKDGVDVHYMSKFAVLCDAKEKKLYGVVHDLSDDRGDQEILEMIAAHMRHYGKPKTIKVGTYVIHDVISQVCDALDIRLVNDEPLKFADIHVREEMERGV